MPLPLHALSIIVLTPIVAAIAIMLAPRTNLFAVRMIGAFAAGLDLILSVWACYAYISGGLTGLQFADRMSWVPAVGISYFVAADGISLALVLLTSIVIFCGVFASWTVNSVVVLGRVSMRKR